MKILPEIQRPRLVVFLLCLAVNLSVLTAISISNPAYLKDYRLAGTKDGKGYIRIGENLILRGHYSRHQQPPYVPNVHRTPGYPVVAGTLYVLFGVAGIYVAQSLFHAISCVLLYELGQLCFSSGVGFWAAVCLALDFVVITGVFKPLSEVTFILLLLAGLRFLVVPLSRECSLHQGGTCATLGGLFFGLSILTRPAGLYLPLLCIFSLAGVGLARGNLKQAIVLPVLFALLTYLPPAAWIARNQAVFDLPKLTTGDAQMAVFQLGSASYQIRHDVSREEAHAMICDEFDLPAFHEIHNVDFEGGDIRTMYYAVKKAAKPVLRKYPKATLQAGLTGIFNSLTAHTGKNYAKALNTQWKAPNKNRLLRGDREALSHFFSNHPAMWMIVAWQMVLHLGAILFAAFGVLSTIRHPRRYSWATWLLLLVTAYFCAIPAMSAFVASSRAALPAWPLLLLLAAHGVACLVTRSRDSDE